MYFEKNRLAYCKAKTLSNYEVAVAQKPESQKGFVSEKIDGKWKEVLAI
ncbi:MAG: hypothetical protein OHK0038_05040 [Flammeovirgaceae bacterium]